MAFIGQLSSVSHINLMDVDASGRGANPARLTHDVESENYPLWSPDGRRLVYQRAFNGSAVYVINADGSGQQRLSPTPGFDTSPSWSPDGNRIVYARLHSAPQPGQPPPVTDIRVMNADGTGDHAILESTVFSVEPQWSVNGRLVFMSLMSGSNLDIYVINLDGTGLRQLTNAAGNNGDPVWSPDGTRITFGSDREGGNKLNVFTMNADGSEVVQLTHFDVPDEAGNPNWSSDGKKIAFQHDTNGLKQSDPDAPAEVWTMNPDGSGAVGTGVPCSNVGCDPTWQPLATGAAGSSFLPVALSELPGAHGSLFTTEATLVNRSSVTALDVTLTLTSLFDGDFASSTLTVPRGASLTYGDFLREAIPGLPAGALGGTVALAATESGTSTMSDALAIVARTTTPVGNGHGRAGLAYLGVPASGGLTDSAWIAGLRQNASDRSNLAYLNAGTTGEVTLRVSIYSSLGMGPAILADETLSPGQFRQINEVLTSNGLALSEGYVKVSKVGGAAPFYAYGVINDERSSDGSFISPATSFGTAGLTLPVAVEGPTFDTEVMITNTSAQGKSLRATYVVNGSRATTVINLLAGEQRIIPSFVQFLRQSLPPGTVPAAGPTLAGPVFVTPEGAGDVSGIVVGARTATRPSSLGRFGVFTPAVPYGSAFSGMTRIDGLRQDDETRSNLALVNTGETDDSDSTFKLEILDDTGASVGEREETVASGGFVQIDKILEGTGARLGSVQITRTSGQNPYIAFGILNDGSDVGERTGDGSYIPAQLWRPELVVSKAQIVFMANAMGQAPPGSGDPGAWELVTMNLDGSSRTQVTHNQEQEFLPHFSPDGTRLLYTRYAKGGYGDVGTETRVTVYDFTTGSSTDLTVTGKDTSPVWSPDGSKIAFLSTRDNPNHALWVMASDGSNAHEIGHPSGDSPDLEWGDMAWSSQNWILFVVGENNASNTCFKVRMDKIRPDGSERTQVTDGGPNCTPPGWEQVGEADPGFSADGSTIYTSRGFPYSPPGMPGATTRKLFAVSSDAWHPGKPERDLSLAGSPDCVEGVPKGAPDGTHILLFRACAQTGVLDAGVFVTDTAGTYRTRITNGFGADWNPAWKP